MKIARRCGAKQIWKSKCKKHISFGALLEVHAFLARSTFRSQSVQSTPRSKHFWKLTCSKRARCLRTDGLGPLSAVEMSKKCTPLWRETHVEVSMLKRQHVRTPLLDIHDAATTTANYFYTTLQYNYNYKCNYNYNYTRH